MEYACFNRFEIAMDMDDALSCSHQGQCDQDVADLLDTSADINAQLDAIGAEAIRQELKEYGAWDCEELADDAQNRHRIVWCAANDIKDERDAG